MEQEMFMATMRDIAFIAILSLPDANKMYAVGIGFVLFFKGKG